MDVNQGKNWKHFRWSTSCGGATLVWDGNGRYGISRCSKKDKFSSRRGRRVAAWRMRRYPHWMLRPVWGGSNASIIGYPKLQGELDCDVHDALMEALDRALERNGVVVVVKL